MASLVAFRCYLIMYNCSVSFIAENKLAVVVSWGQYISPEVYFIMPKVHAFDLSWICFAACCTTNPQQIEGMNFGLIGHGASLPENIGGGGEGHRLLPLAGA